MKAFIKLFGAILKIKNILVSFDEFEGNQILSERDFRAGRISDSDGVPARDDRA